jgi:L-alanine-DL-glutamate epimerase-like enolase superfamily enzyme
MICNHFSHELRFQYPFTISRGTKTHQPTLVTQLDFRGIKGYGEAPAIAYYDTTVEKMVAHLLIKKQFVEKYAFTDPARYWHYLHHLMPQSNFLVCALDMAAWDIYGKMQGRPLYEIWNLETANAPLTDYTIGIDTIDKMVEKINAKPWPIYKIKLGTAEDIGIMRALRSCTNASFRVDANAGWTLEEALVLIPQLKDLGVELVEQPLARDNWEGMKRLYHESVLPLIADESCVVESDVEKCHRHFHGINIKLTKCSGITPALRMITRARELEMSVMIGSMNESTVGTAAIAHLAPLADHLDADGPLLLAEDLATGIGFDPVAKGRLTYSGLPGLGIEYTGLYEK